MFPPLRRWTGPLTEDMVLHPGVYGLGKVPARLKPDATTGLVCGFCSTGCALDVHLREGAPVNLSPARGYPAVMQDNGIRLRDMVWMDLDL